MRQTEIWLRVPEVTGRVINVTANTTIHVEDLDDESTYVICSRTRNSAGAAYSSIVTCDTPVDQAKIMIKKDGNWWYAIAPKTPYNGGVPGPSAQVFRQTEIWLRVPEVTGRVINVTANTTIHVEDLDDESTYVICSRTRNSAGAAYSSIVTCDTPVDQAKIMIKKDGNWVLGKTFIKVNGEWIKAKKVYIKKDGQWVVNVNPRN